MIHWLIDCPSANFSLFIVLWGFYSVYLHLIVVYQDLNEASHPISHQMSCSSEQPSTAVTKQTPCSSVRDDCFLGNSPRGLQVLQNIAECSLFWSEVIYDFLPVFEILLEKMSFVHFVRPSHSQLMMEGGYCTRWPASWTVSFWKKRKLIQFVDWLLEV